MLFIAIDFRVRIRFPRAEGEPPLVFKGIEIEVLYYNHQLYTKYALYKIIKIQTKSIFLKEFRVIVRIFYWT